MKSIADRGIEVRVADIEDSVEDLLLVLSNIDILISAIDAEGQLAQKNLATAAKKAGVKRFVPCAFITVAPVGGVMLVRDQVG